MRYIDAYEIIQASLNGKVEGFPITEKLLSTYFDSSVMDVGKRVVRDIGIYSYSYNNATLTDSDVASYSPFAIGYKHSRGFLLNTPSDPFRELGGSQDTGGSATDEPLGNSVFKVELDGKNIPFVDEKRVLTTNTDTSVEDYEIGWWLWHDRRAFIATGVTNASSMLLTGVSPSKGIVVGKNDVLMKGERINISGLQGGESFDRELLNTKTTLVYNVAVPSAVNVAINYNSSAARSQFETSPSLGGIRFVTNNYWVMFNKIPTVSDDIKVWHYKEPLIKNGINAVIDLPDSLAQACIYHTIGHIINLVGNLQIASGYRGLARKMELEYTDTHSKNAPMPDILPNPLIDFNYTS